MVDFSISFPPQKLSYKAKNESWCKKCVDWAASRSYFRYSPVRKDVVRMKTNYDLVNGKIHMEDVAVVLNPGGVSTISLPDKIQHFPIINSKLNTLRGEEAARVFDWHVIVTNPYAISKMEEDKKAAFDQMVQGIVEDTTMDDQEAQNVMREQVEEFNYSWQDIREIRGNELLKHYSKELNFKQMWNDGFMDACISSVEGYMIDIVGGEPFAQRINPMKLRSYRLGSSNRLEDADVLVYEDYMSRGRIVDIWKDDLSASDIKWLSDEIPDINTNGTTGIMGNEEERGQFVREESVIGEDGIMISDDGTFSYVFDGLSTLEGGLGSPLMPYDVAGNIRVTRVWWKSLRKIYEVEWYDEETGEKNYDFFPETYIPDESRGEKAKTLWVNEMWQGVKIGEKIYTAMRPCSVQHNSISNPSRCHAGIIGTVYNLNEAAPYSLVDMMKPYNYFYDAVHAKLVDLIATNWGKLLELDLAMKPKNWQVEKWMYFARANKVLIRDSFNEGTKGAATGKLAGGLNNASKGYVDADWGQSIQNYINMLEWASESMSNIVGINRQREGNTYNRETVGGIERAVLQSSYITDWLFQKHDDTKKRFLESFIEYCKAAIRGRSKKFQYILSDNSRKIMDIPGDEFCECDYGLVVDNSNDTQKLYQNLDSLATAAMQNQYKLSSIARMYASTSLAEKTRMLESYEKQMQQEQQMQQQQQAQLQQQQIQAEMQAKQAEMEQKDRLAQLDSETKIRVAEINSKAEELRLGIYETQNNIDLRNQELEIERRKLDEEIRGSEADRRLKEQEMQQKRDIEMKKIEAQKTIAANRNNKK